MTRASGDGTLRGFLPFPSCADLLSRHLIHGPPGGVLVIQAKEEADESKAAFIFLPNPQSMFQPMDAGLIKPHIDS